MNPYMRRERIESPLDKIFSERLTDRDLLSRIAHEYLERSKSATSKKDLLRIQRTHKRLEGKRKRLFDAYFENLLGRADLDRRLEEMKAEEQFCEQKLLGIQSAKWDVSEDKLTKILEPLVGWTFLSRTDKRRLLQTLIPEVHVENYGVTKLALLVQEPYRDEITRSGRDLWPRPT
jgi:hypothetical protein